MTDKVGGFHLTPDDIGELYKIVEELRGTNAEAQRILATDETAQELALIYERLGEDVTPVVLDAAVKEYTARMFTFTPAKPGAGLTLASCYLNRNTIGKWAFVGGSVAGLIAGTAALAYNQFHRLQEASVEERVETAYHTQTDIRARIELLETSPLVKDLPTAEQKQLETLLLLAKGKISLTETFFGEYCSEGTAVDGVTRENYPRATSHLSESVIPLFAEVEEGIASGEQILGVERGLQSTARQLDSLRATIRQAAPPTVLLQQAEQTYHLGKGAVTSRRRDTAEQQLEQMERLQSEIMYFTQTSATLDGVYRSVRDLARESVAIERAERGYQEARQARDNANVPALRKAVGELQSLSAILNQEYELRIVTRAGVKSGIDRYYTDEQGKRTSGFYLIVEAVEGRNAVSMEIRNEEDGQIRRVAMWGVRVPKGVYETVKGDKQDNGVIEDAVVGGKRRGYLSPQYEQRFQIQGGQITEW